jgi:lysophospholipase L1-like esterase
MAAVYCHASRRRARPDPDSGLTVHRPAGPPRRLLLAAPALLVAGAARAADKPPSRPPLAVIPLSRTNLDWWRDRHQEKLAELKVRQPDLVFYGDSITQQWEYRGPPDYLDFAPVWDRFYGHRNAVNLGYGGDTTSNLIWRIQNGEAAGISPRAAVILIGANNLGRLRWSAADTVAGIERIIGELQKRLTATKLLLLGILPSDRSDWTTTTTNEVNRLLAAKYPKGHAVTYLDLGHLFLLNGKVNHDMYFDRRVKVSRPPLHPTAQAMARLAEAMEPTLAALLKR